MRRVESTVDQSPEKMEKGESSLSQQAGDLLGRGANTLSTNADRAEASKALTKDGTLPDFQLDMGDNTNPSSPGASDSSISAIPDNFDPNPEASGDSNNGGAPSDGGDSATEPANPSNSDFLPPAATAENSTND